MTALAGVWSMKSSYLSADENNLIQTILFLQRSSNGPRYLAPVADSVVDTVVDTEEVIIGRIPRHGPCQCSSRAAFIIMPIPAVPSPLRLSSTPTLSIYY